MDAHKELIPFEGKPIRKVWHNEEWYFSVIDVIQVLTDSVNAQSYWGQLKKREPQLLTICQKFKFLAFDGKMRPTECANTKGILRIIMSVPSPRVEPLKLWLAEVGSEHIAETERPELIRERQIALYKAKGRTDEWIEKRMDTIDKRNKLTDEWKNRGVKEGKEYSILTAVIAKGTFGLTPNEHKKLKGLEKPNQDLRDNMTPLELIFTSLAEQLTREETIKDDAQGFDENKTAAVKGGNMAGEARELIEKRRGEKVVSSRNFLPPSKAEKVLPPSDDTPTLF